MGQLLHGVPDAAHQGALVMPAGLALHPCQEVPLVELLELLVHILHLLGRLVANHGGQQGLVRAPPFLKPAESMYQAPAKSGP